ncbi:MAG: M23 family metallopeptidase [Flavobacteriaceae bacterium]|nr:M23 family metallopeptidase [Flavobacteriaceae bacterium]
MYRKQFLEILFIFFSSIIYSQNVISPLDIPLNISGTFGELRNTHFHTGIDIKTKGKQGLKVKSIKDGYVVWIRVNKGGYGKSIYIKHSDGTTSIYAHLKMFSNEIEEYVKKIQYQKKSYEIQNFPEVSKLNFNAGDLIGFTGNTGSSSGPHLHFEVRNSKTNNPINPIKIGLKIFDSIKPKIKGLYVYKVYEDGSYDFLKRISIRKISDGNYEASTIEYIGNLGIGINYYDQQDKTYSKNGAYSIDFNINKQSVFNYKMDKISFDDKRDLKLLVDYENWYINKNKIQKLFTHPKSRYSFIKKSSSEGVFTVLNSDSYIGSIKIEDFNGNRTEIKLKFEGAIKDSLMKISKNKLINPEYEYSFNKNGISVNFPKNSFYNPINLEIKSKNDTLDLGKNIHPINKSFEINYKINSNDTVLNSKGFISKINKYGNPLYLKTKKEDNVWTVKASELGKYTLSVDTISPSVKPINFKKNQWISNLNFLKLKVKDDLSGIRSIKGSINGRWVLFEHEPKNNIISYNFSDNSFPNGKHLLKIEVVDLIGNEYLFETIFFKKY